MIDVVFLALFSSSFSFEIDMLCWSYKLLSYDAVSHVLVCFNGDN
jgi:hypothetical protein